MASPAKKQKTEQPAEEETKEAQGASQASEPQEEAEKDQGASKAPINEAAKFHVHDTTVNVLASPHVGVLKSLSDGGFQHLLAGARASVGVKSGRHVFEAKVIEFMHPVDEQSHRTRVAGPRQVFRMGFATSDSPLLIGESEGSVCFSMDGTFLYKKQRTLCATSFGRDNIMAVVLNLDEKSPNYNTVSLFKDGQRICPPQRLPDDLQGKPLFPTVTFRNVTLQVHFGPELLRELPFKCRTIGAADKADAILTKPIVSEAGKFEVVFPVSLPDQGSFDWLDMFLEQNPGYTELSDRAILDWCEKSGIPRSKGYGSKSSADKPDFGFGIASLDDGSVRRLLRNIAPLQERNFVLMEVKGNLVKEEREEIAARFDAPHFKRVATVLVGEPALDFKKRTSKLILAQKQETSDAQWRIKKAEEKRKKEAAQRQKALDKAKKKLEKERKKAQEAIKKKAEDESQKKKEGADEKKTESATTDEAGKDSKDGTDEKPDAEAKGADEDKKDKEEVEPKETNKADEVDEDEDEEKEDDEEMDDDTEEPPKAELTDEEKKQWFRTSPTPDLTDYALNTSFAKFSLPQKSEGFEEVRYEWTRGSKAEDFVKKWILERKLTTRVEDLKPSPSFHQKYADWQRAYQLWTSRQLQYKSVLEQKLASAKAKEAKKQAKQAAAKAAAEKAAQSAEEKANEEKEGENSEKAPDESMNQEGEDGEDEAEGEAKGDTVDFDNLDVFGVEDILDIGGGVPLFKDLLPEDWTMMNLRAELHLMAYSFRRDVDDPERTGIHMDHLPFYYQKYFKKALNLSQLGCSDIRDLLALVKDTLFVSDQKVVESILPDDMESYSIFAKLTEEERRHRQLRIDLGEDAARLKVSHVSHQKGGTGKPGWQRNPTNTSPSFGAGKATGKGSHWQGLGVRKNTYGKGGFRPPLPQQASLRHGGRSYGKGQAK